MKRIIHLSDLHFGTERDGIVPQLVEDIYAQDPDLIVVSGDITQRATHKQYALAKSFLQEIKKFKTLCVPGNHDISLTNPIERFLYPYQKYRQWISPDLCVYTELDHLAILGINSVTPYKIMSGYITEKQLAMVTAFFQNQAEDVIKIIVMHHNLISSRRHKIINDSDKILNIFAASGVNIVLSGHIHYAYAEQLEKPYINHKLYIVTAGTAISHRTSEPNSYNVLDFSLEHFKIKVRSHVADKYTQTIERDLPY